MPRNRLGFSLVETIVVLLLLAVVASVAVPRALKPSPARQVELAALALSRDLALLRMRAIAAKRQVRVRFYTSQDFYTAFMDTTVLRSASITETAGEVNASQLLARGSSAGLPGVQLPRGVEFGTGIATSGPSGYEASGAIVLANGDYVDFDSRGMVMPAGAGGVVYLTHGDYPAAVAAVTITGASAFRTWVLRSGEWTK
ncbi:MAG: prepilin-type N-terminal cleavage/methylation domain-containing protein [Gemmatimonadota bacterium]|nr:MAG: prepilin-type N-terminal cleavage/methylation domain-containing protein [Gemmatimonadota bacterium]